METVTNMTNYRLNDWLTAFLPLSFVDFVVIRSYLCMVRNGLLRTSYINIRLHYYFYREYFVSLENSSESSSSLEDSLQIISKSSSSELFLNKCFLHIDFTQMLLRVFFDWDGSARSLSFSFYNTGCQHFFFYRPRNKNIVFTRNYL